MKRWLIAGAGIGLLIILGIVGIMFLRPDPLIPASIKKQLTTTLLLPSPEVGMIDQSSVKYAPDIKLLNFNLTTEGTKLVVSEQPTPESFTDIPQVYDKVIEGMREYHKFETAVGMVHLTRPKDLHGKQSAVLNTKGTLLFANPDRDLSEDQWHRFFNSIDVVR